jgi:DNA-directed RNA polymerase specialized sigma24 family protein
MKTISKEHKSNRLVALLNRHRAGDKTAFAVLDKVCRPRLLDWLEWKFPNAPFCAYCDDAAQEALARLDRGTESLLTDHHLLNWLREVAKNTMKNAHRRRRPTANSLVIDAALGATA